MRVPSLQPSRPLAWILLGASALHFAAAGVLRPILRPYGYASDFATFYAAARMIERGQDPYDRDALDALMQPQFDGWVGRYLYPPPFAATVMRPFAALSFATARRLWILVEAVAFVTAGMLLLRRFCPAPTAMTMAIAGSMLLLFTPIRIDFKLGSVSGILLLLFALFIDARARAADWRAAFTLAAMIVLKLAPAVLLFYMLCRGELRRVARTLLACVAILAGTLPWTGLHTHATYVRHVLPDLFEQPFAWFTNQSLDAFFARILVPNPDTTPWLVAPSLALALSLAAALAVATAVFAVARRDARRSDASGWGPAIALVASLLVARVTWESMLVLTLPCFLLCVEASRDGTSGRRTTGVWVLAYLLCALPFHYAATPVHAGAGLLLEAPRLYGMLLLFAGSVAYRLRRA